MPMDMGDSGAAKGIGGMGGMEMEPGTCKISMLWNWSTVGACFISETWQVTSKGMFAGSCVGVVCLVMSLEFLRRLSREYERWIAQTLSTRKKSCNENEPSTAVAARSQQEKNAEESDCSKDERYSFVTSTIVVASSTSRVKPTILQQTGRAMVHMLQFGVAYFIVRTNAPRHVLQRLLYHLHSDWGFSRVVILSWDMGISRATEVRIVEVGPRDGLQNEKKSIPVATKVQLVNKLAKTGIQTIEAGSFVSPKWVPQMASSDEILESINRKPPTAARPITYQWLLPNMRGLDNYIAVQEAFARPGSAYASKPPADLGPASNTSSSDPNAMPSARTGTEAMAKKAAASTPSASSPAHEISLFLAATESFSKRNTNCTIAESLERFRPIIKKAQSLDTSVRAYISVALGCPYEGPNVSAQKVTEIAADLLEMGANEVCIADTTGMATAPRTLELLRSLSSAGIRNSDLALHFHDTYGQALVNTVVGLEHGIRTFDSAVGGLGGCPFSPGATGNVATEDLIHCLHSLGADTGVDLEQVAEIGAWISQEIGKGNDSRAGKATLARKQ